MKSKIDKSTAFTLIEQYINAWKHNDIKSIINCLCEDIIIIESHGPKYVGIQAIKQWVDLWLIAKSKVNKWEILSFNFCEENQIAFCEWDFDCISNNKKYVLSGISQVKFTNHKISHIHEYRMTKPEYLWTEDQLNSV